MGFSGDPSTNGPDIERGEPGSEDAYARGATDASESDSPDAGDSGDSGPAANEGARALAEQREKYLRLAAEFDNYRRRSTKERQDAGARAQADLVRQLIDALDDLGRFAHLDPATVDPRTIVQGVEMVEKKLHKAFGAAGLEIVDPIDQPFDPALHEAVSTEAATSQEDDHQVARVFQRGYVFNGQLLRPARVVVRQWNG
jgi:molecular chaperone GrpE